MSILTTFNMSTRRVSIEGNTSNGVALANNTIYYAIATSTLKLINLDQDFTSVTYALLDFVELFDSLQPPYTVVDEIVLIESHGNNVILLTTNGTEQRLTSFNVVNGTITGTYTIPLLTIDSVVKNRNSFVFMSGTTGIIFSITDVTLSEPKIISAIRTAVFDSNTSTIYYTHINDIVAVRSSNYVNHANTSTMNISDAIVLSSNDVTPINHINITTEGFVITTTNSNERYNLATKVFETTTPVHVPYNNQQSFKVDENGHLFTNSVSTQIYDTKFSEAISTNALGGITLNDLQTVQHIQVNNFDVLIQTNNEIVVIQDITESSQIQSIQSLNAQVTNSINIKTIDHKRLLEYILPIGEHSISIQCTDVTVWQDNFNLSFYIDAGFDKRLKQLEETAKISCTLYLNVNTIPTLVTVNLTNVFNSIDVLTSKYDLLDYRLVNDSTTTLRQFIQNKTVFFDNTVSHNIVFNFDVNSTIRSNKHSTLRFHLLKVFTYANASRIILTL